MASASVLYVATISAGVVPADGAPCALAGPSESSSIPAHSALRTMNRVTRRIVIATSLPAKAGGIQGRRAAARGSVRDLERSQQGVEALAIGLHGLLGT